MPRTHWAPATRSTTPAAPVARGEIHLRRMAMAGHKPAGHEHCMDESVDRAGHRGGQDCTDQQTCRCCGLTEHRGSYCSACSSHQLDFHAPHRSEAQRAAIRTARLQRKTARPRPQEPETLLAPTRATEQLSLTLGGGA